MTPPTLSASIQARATVRHDSAHGSASTQFLSFCTAVLLGLLTGCGAEKTGNPAAKASPPSQEDAKVPELSLHDGKFVIDARSVPCIGSPRALTLVALLADYTCGHCFELKKQAADAVAKSEGKLAVLTLPAVRGERSEQMHRLMLTLFHADAALHGEIEARIEAGQIKAEPAILREAVAAALGGSDTLAVAESKHHPEVDAFLRQMSELLDANARILGSTNVPQFMAGGKILHGARPSVDHLLAEAFGTAPPESPVGDLAFEAPEINFGKTAGGTVTNFIVKVTNRGKQPHHAPGLKLPEGFSVVRSLPAQIKAGTTETMTLRWRFPIKTGAFRETVLLKNRGNADATLTIKADLWEAYSLSEPKTVIHMGADGKPAKPEPLIVSLKEAAKLSVIENDSGLKPSVRALGDDGKRFEVSFSVDASKPVLPRGGHLYFSLSPITEKGARTSEAPAFVVLPVDLKFPAQASDKS